MPPSLKQISPSSIVTSLVMTICTFVIIRYIGSVGDRVDATHDSMIRVEQKQTQADKDISEIKTTMMTRNDMTVEFLKLQKK